MGRKAHHFILERRALRRLRAGCLSGDYYIAQNGSGRVLVVNDEKN